MSSKTITRSILVAEDPGISNEMKAFLAAVNASGGPSLEAFLQKKPAKWQLNIVKPKAR